MSLFEKYLEQVQTTNEGWWDDIKKKGKKKGKDKDKEKDKEKGKEKPKPKEKKEKKKKKDANPKFGLDPKK